VALSTGSAFVENSDLFVGDYGRNNGWVSDGTDQYPRMAADVNGDGYADIVAISQTAVHVSLCSNGTSWEAVQVWSSNYAVNAGYANNGMYPRTLADVNGDGMADLVAFGNIGVFVALSTGSAFVENSDLFVGDYGMNTGWGSDGTDQYPRMAADVNGDGKADIVAIGQSKVHVSLVGFTGSNIG